MIEGADKAVDNVRRKIGALRDKRALYLAAKGTMVEVSKRVWGKGGLTEGGTIDYKQDYELYAYTPPSPKKVTGKGKPFKEWKNSGLRAPKTNSGTVRSGQRKIKGGYYKTYLDYKKQQGRADLPFELTGRLRKAYLSSNDTPDSLFEVSPTEVVIKLRGKDEVAKYEGLTETKGNFLGLTAFEIRSYQERLRDIYNEA